VWLHFFKSWLQCRTVRSKSKLCKSSTCLKIYSLSHPTPCCLNSPPRPPESSSTCSLFANTHGNPPPAVYHAWGGGWFPYGLGLACPQGPGCYRHGHQGEATGKSSLGHRGLGPGAILTLFSVSWPWAERCYCTSWASPMVTVTLDRSL
jgi:hypothetical protein